VPPQPQVPALSRWQGLAMGVLMLTIARRTLVPRSN
jgi:hypothetical protein